MITNHTFQNKDVFPVHNFRELKQKVLNWAQQFNTFCFLDNHHYHFQPHTQECLLAAGEKRKIAGTAGNVLGQLQSFISQKPAWLFGHLGYDLKNELGNFSTNQPDNIGFADVFFFEPEVLIELSEEEITIEADNPLSVFDDIMAVELKYDFKAAPPLLIQNRLSKEEYISTIKQLQKHILRGDCYEINFCQEFYVEQATINPLAVYNDLTDISPNPFSALYKTNDKWLICASPERFLKKQGNTIISQPIKGTSVRVPGDQQKDISSKKELLQSDKDRSENVMIVDLVRNDLAKVCTEGSVKVDELFGVYSFPQVHQMISTISGQVKANVSFSDIIRATFPMGSMTGAPKKRVIELIGEYEKTKRGIFSGAVGYISPEGDFDFNVVIRSIMYNAASRYLSFQAGSGITFYSDAEKEWEECMLKVSALKAVLKDG